VTKEGSGVKPQPRPRPDIPPSQDKKGRTPFVPGIGKTEIEIRRQSDPKLRVRR
jgi:hypothetical protein